MKKFFLFGLMLLAVHTGTAQTARVLADKIIAIVGDKMRCLKMLIVSFLSG